MIARSGTFTSPDRASVSACKKGHYCLNGEKTICPENTFEPMTNSSSCTGKCSKKENKFSIPGAHACSCFGTFLKVNSGENEFECLCLPGYYRKVKDDVPQCALCDAGTIQPGNTTFASSCTSCGFFETSNEDRTKCVTSMATVLPLALILTIVLGTATYFLNRKLKRYKVHVKKLDSRIASQKNRLRKKSIEMQQLVKLNQPTQKQEDIFEQYRKIIREGDDDEMPYRIKMYEMENITLQKSLGKGAYGEVIKGVVKEEHFGETIQKEIALKQLHIKNESSTNRVLGNFLDEVRNLAQVGSNDNVVAFYGVAWDAQNFPSIVLEFVPGGELNSYLEDFNCVEGDGVGLANPTLLAIALGIVRGVQHIHDKGMVHRDLKPQNILLDDRYVGMPPVPKIADFGESRETDTELTMTYVGTALYIAPEVYRGERYGRSADVFSLGIILNQIDTRQSPATGVNYTAMNAREPGSARPRFRENIPKQIRSLLESCLTYDPEGDSGPEGDLSYGRPSIDSLLIMVSRLAEEELKYSSGKSVQSLSSSRSLPAIADGAERIKDFMELEGKKCPTVFKEISHDEIWKLLEIYEKYKKDQKLSETISTTTSGNKSMSTIQALLLSIDAHSLDEFLNLTRLTHHKEQILALGIGSTLKELAASGYTSTQYHEKIPGIKRQHANRLERQLRKWREKRESEASGKKKRVTSYHEGMLRSLDAEDLDEFLDLLKMKKFKQGILDLGIGTTIMELAESGYDCDRFCMEVQGMLGNHGERLARQLRRYKEKREGRRSSIIDGVEFV